MQEQQPIVKVVPQAVQKPQARQVPPRKYEDRDPNVIQWRIVEKLVDPSPEQIVLLTELSDKERRWMSRHKAFIKFMETPLYHDRLYVEGELINNQNAQLIIEDGKKIVREWNGPVFLDEANNWYMKYGVSLSRKSRGEFLAALGKIGGNIMGFMRGTKIMNDEDQLDKPWWKFWG